MQDYILFQNHVEFDVPEGKRVYLSRGGSMEQAATIESRRYNRQARAWQNGPTFVLQPGQASIETNINGGVRISLRYVQGSEEHNRFVMATVKSPDF